VNNSADTPITIKGYVTDPKFVGYQILTNYENTYWLRLVGRDAWMLYLVLRSFCHDGNPMCHPSIKLLMNILGLTDRRQLIGRVDTTPSKKRVLPGFIDVLQEHGLVTAEIRGDGPKQRYVFHVELTPPLLTADQVQQLPKPLQKRHEKLLERVSEEMAKLENLKANREGRVKKTIKAEPVTEANSEADVGAEEGGGTVPPPLVQYHPPPGTVPPKQQPINNTQTTRARDIYNNNSNGANHEPENAVVVALSSRGIAKKVAEKLVRQHTAGYIEEKIEYHDFLKTERPQDIQKPAAWLRKAVEDDYSAPDGFISAADREQHLKAEEEHLRAVTEAQRHTSKQSEERQAQQAAQMEYLIQQYGVTEEEIAIWQQTLSDIQRNMQPVAYETYLKGSLLLSIREGTARITLKDPKGVDWVKRQLSRLIQTSLSEYAGETIERLEIEHVPELYEFMTG